MRSPRARPSSQDRAIELLTQYVGGFSKRHELTGKDGERLSPPTGPVYIIGPKEAEEIRRELDNEV